LEHKIGLHVDGCLGGFLLPFVEKAGYKVRPFDFRVAGVTSISADTHKYGYAPKGSSVVMYRNRRLRSSMYFVASQWTGGIYTTATMPGSRPGGLVAATWAALIRMGESGYVECARAIMQASKQIEAGIRQMDGIMVLGQPDMSVIAFGTDPRSLHPINVLKVGEAMKSIGGWSLNVLQRPPSVHICCTYMHRNVADKFLNDLQQAIQQIRDNPKRFQSGSAAIYGLAQTIPDSALVDEIGLFFLDCLYETPKQRDHQSSSS